MSDNINSLLFILELIALEYFEMRYNVVKLSLKGFNPFRVEVYRMFYRGFHPRLFRFIPFRDMIMAN
jgi:hypothetical protein